MHAQFGCCSIGGAFLIKLEDIRVDHAPNGGNGWSGGIPPAKTFSPLGVPDASKTFDRQAIAYLMLRTICCVLRR